MKPKLLITLLAALLATTLSAQGIDRKAVVQRNNPHITRLDPLGSLAVGNGGFAFTVDATGLQSFPEQYSKGVCLGTFGNYWHAFPNTNRYRPSEAWVAKDFGRGHKEVYAAQFRTAGRQQDASNYFRANPHRLHLGNVGLVLADTSRLSNIDQQLDLWTGKITSTFGYGKQRYRVETVCLPDADAIATHVASDGDFAIALRFAYPTGGHADDACDWTKDHLHQTTYTATATGATIRRTVDGTTYYVHLAWKGKARLARTAPHTLTLRCGKGDVQLQCEYSLAPRPSKVFEPFARQAAAAAAHWNGYWSVGGFIDFGHVADPRARELERRVILSQYLMGAQEAGDCPPQETGLTYNSWYGKFHLEMTWWHLAHYGLWGRPQLLDRSLSWYLTAADSATAIARRQGFRGLRWMKMTDPEAGEAPSNVGSYLIWQQPHLIYLAELLYRSLGQAAATAGSHGDAATLRRAWASTAAAPNAQQRAVIEKYGHLVDQTAVFMADFATYDSTRHRYTLHGYIPAQETLKADSTTNSPFELNYWHTTLAMAQQWRQRAGQPRQPLYDSIVARLAPLAFNADSLYLAAETATQTYTDRRFTSDHPAILGALGILPESRLTNRHLMARTLDWIWHNWNWPTSWGWDFPMTAMACARLGQPSRAVDALLMPQQKNTYLVNGHNYQDKRLRVYMPGNGGLLAAVAMMAAGWDGCTEGRAPGFPADWDVRWEGIVPMP